MPLCHDTGPSALKIGAGENRLGANGSLATEAVARAPADGHTLLWAITPQIAINPAMMKVNYDPVKDFVPISTINANTFALIVNPRMPVKTVAEFVDYARVQPKELVYAEGGVGSIGHLSMALFLNRAGMVRAYLRAVVQLRAEGGNHRNDGD